MSTISLQGRLWLVIESEISSNRRFKELEGRTGIPADRWKALSLNRQRPTAEMIEAICKEWPQYAFWLSTGVSDPDFGHVAPSDSGFPRGGSVQQNSTSVFKAYIELRKAVEVLTRSWVKEEFGAEGIDGDLLVTDLTMRITEQLRCINDKSLSDLRKKVSIAKQLRRAEVLLQVEEPMLDYEDTERLVNLLEIDVSKARAKAERVGLAVNAVGVEEKLQQLRENIEGWKRRENLVKNLSGN
ncbi:hypothetical protein [Chromobacterium vaccinii]|uniref:hypothetical protein n=1 Tax=Chromobacterium vaccinii TaxID=1108595 RepID=UPI001E3555B0|nr:hypothetical protein [Chromobacterium vaccinii]MCD4500164.1 hypothetical protein [Chromobacterium vaccinii]